MSDKEEKKETKKKSSEVSKKHLEEYLSDKQAGQYQNNKQFIDDKTLIHGACQNSQKEREIYCLCHDQQYLAKRIQQYKIRCVILNEFWIIIVYNDIDIMANIFIEVNKIMKLNLFSQDLVLFFKEILIQYYIVKADSVYDLGYFKQSFYNKIQDYVKKVDEGNKDKLFGLGLDDLELNDQQMPKVIMEFINYFKQNEDHIKESGIFRKVPREYDLKVIEKELINKNYEFIQNHDDPHVVANSLKRLLSQMPEPIFPFKQYELIKQLQAVKDPIEKKSRVHSIIQQIPALNFRVLRQIIDLLRTISKYSDSNLMKMEALTKIFAPTLTRGKPRQDKDKMQEAIEELMMNPTVVEMVQIIYMDYDEIFTKIEESKQEFNNILSSMIEDLPDTQNNNQKLQNPIVQEQQKYNYYVCRNQNIFMGENIQNNNGNGRQIFNPYKINIKSKINFFENHNEQNPDDDDDEDEEEWENRENIKSINNNQNKHSQINKNPSHINYQNQNKQQKYEDEEQEEEFIIRKKSHAIQIDDPTALRAFLNSN